MQHMPTPDPQYDMLASVVWAPPCWLLQSTEMRHRWIDASVMVMLKLCTTLIKIILHTDSHTKEICLYMPNCAESGESGADVHSSGQ